MLVFDDLNVGDQIFLRYRFGSKPIQGTFLGFCCDKKRFINRLVRTPRMELQLANGAIVKPRTSDIVPGSMYLVGSYRTLE